jgi:hypothetical protein
MFWLWWFLYCSLLYCMGSIHSKDIQFLFAHIKIVMQFSSPIRKKNTHAFSNPYFNINFPFQSLEENYFLIPR